MSPLRALVRSVVDLRPGEGRALARAAGCFFLLIAAHTILETARDAILLTGLDPSALGVTYVLAAVVVLPASILSSRLALRYGLRATLVGGLVGAAAAIVTLFVAPATTSTVLAVYVVSSLVGAVLVPSFWGLLGEVFTIAQGRRLLGMVVAAGTLGAVSGSAAAVAVLPVVPVRALLLVFVGVALAATVVVPRGSPEARTEKKSEPKDIAGPEATSTRESPFSDPFLRHVAWLVTASTAAIVLVDFTFRWTLARSLTADRIGPFVARYYAILGAVGLVVQLLVSRRLVQRFGVARTMVITPVAVVIGGVCTVALGGSMGVVLALKALDATLRHSVYRLTMELAYLPVRHATRMRAKPIIDGAIVRLVQGGAGGALLVAGAAGALSSRALAAALLGLATLWLVAAWTIQSPYLALLRRAIGHGDLGASHARDPLDLESAEALLLHLSSDDPLVVLGAMNALARRHRVRMIPALILLHEDEAVLLRALALFAASDRRDWLARARTLLSDRRDRVRMGVVRALAAHRALRARDVADDASARVRGYASTYLALEAHSNARDVVVALSAVLEPAHEEKRLGVLSAMADAGRDPRLDDLLELLAHQPLTPPAAAELARAVASQRAVGLLPMVISRLTAREGREAVRAALLSFGDAALDALREALVTSRARALRMHIPSSIARFGTKRAADLLLDIIEGDADGLVRYKALRALGRLAVERRVELERARVERIATRNLLEYARLFALRARLDPSSLHVPTTPSGRSPTERLLLGILGDKMRQALERTFRLLELVHSHDDIQRIHVAYRSKDGRARANAAELVDALLRRPDEARLRRLLRWVAEQASIDEIVSDLAHAPPATRDDAHALLVADRDAAVAAITELHLAALSGKDSRIVLGSRERPGIELTLDGSTELAEAANA